MARKSRSRSSFGSRPSASRTPLRNPPQPAPRAPPPAPVQTSSGSVMGGFGAAVVDGLALGTGSAVAHRVVDSIMGPRVVRHETVATSAPAAAASATAAAPAPNASSLGDACGGQIKALQDCLNNYGSEISKCQFYMDMLHQCRKGPETVSSV